MVTGVQLSEDGDYRVGSVPWRDVQAPGPSAPPPACAPLGKSLPFLCFGFPTYKM